mgnify:CR=1 FL=1
MSSGSNLQGLRNRSSAMMKDMDKSKKPVRPGKIGEKDKSRSKAPIRSKLSHEKHDPAAFAGSQSKDGKGYKLGE